MSTNVDQSYRPIEYIVSCNANRNGIKAKFRGWAANGLHTVIMDEGKGDAPSRRARTRANKAQRLKQNRNWRLRYGYLDKEEIKRMQRGQMWASWPGEARLWVRKKLFSDALMEFRAKHPNAVGDCFFPLGLSWESISSVTRKLMASGMSMDEAQDSIFGSWWASGTPTNEKNVIVKPNMGKGGDGIQIVPLRDLPMMKIKKNWLVQRYLGDPLLIDGLKFDLRLYISIVSIDPLIIVKHSAGLVRFASKKYTDDGTFDATAHLTNAHINETRDEGTGKLSHARMETFEWFKRHVAAVHGVSAEELERRIDEAHTLAIMAFQSRLQRSAHEGFGRNFEPYEYPSFSVIGSDIMFDSQLRPWVIEFNHRPNLGRRDMPQELKGDMFRDFNTAAGLHPRFDRDIARLERPECASSCVARRMKALRKRMGMTGCSFIYPSPHTKQLRWLAVGDHKLPDEYFTEEYSAVGGQGEGEGFLGGGEGEGGGRRAVRRGRQQRIQLAGVKDWNELLQYGLGGLKRELGLRDLKVGGTLEQRARRLFMSGRRGGPSPCSTRRQRSLSGRCQAA